MLKKDWKDRSRAFEKKLELSERMRKEALKAFKYQKTRTAELLEIVAEVRREDGEDSTAALLRGVLVRLQTVSTARCESCGTAAYDEVNETVTIPAVSLSASEPITSLNSSASTRLSLSPKRRRSQLNAIMRLVFDPGAQYDVGVDGFRFDMGPGTPVLWSMPLDHETLLNY